MEKGILVVRGKVIEPPYVMRQKADRIFVNDQEVYPLPEIEKPKKRPLFKVEPEVPEFQVPANIQRVLEDFRTSWASGMIRDVGDLIKDASGMIRSEDFIRDASGMIRDADDFIQDYQEEKNTLKQVLKNKDIPFVETEKYHDILIPVEKEWGVVALFNEAERMKVTAKIDKERPVPFKYHYKDAAKFKQYIETALKEGDMIIMDDDQMEFIPHEHVDDAAKKISGFSAMSVQEKAEALTEKLSVDPTREPTKEMKSAAIFAPHLSWQKEAVGRHSRYPISLAASLKSKGYRVWLLTDTRVTLKEWARLLGMGQKINLRAIYNQGHGNRNAVFVGEPDLKENWYYFTDQFVYKYAELHNTIVYNHSCLTLFDNRLATAFFKKGACTYGGWLITTSANPAYCDMCDGIFWRPLLNGAATGTACRALNMFDLWFACRGNKNCTLP
ncbi:MAG: hypothetical protein HXS48_16380 [Theionarchaea archaeon]|nr:MAG: hypothetical protein AYK19_08355 [Theionarchaea archaeon DG-70-1]MBU7028512.1 hypothetical protein [Theionarchaea archaeon]